MVSGDRGCGVKSQFTFNDAGPLFEMHLATMSDEMNVRDGDGV